MKLMAEYGCFPLWEMRGDDTKNVDPEGLPLTGELKKALAEWAAAYDRTLDQDYPPDSGFASREEEAAFRAEGRRLGRGLEAQIGQLYEVIYDY